MTLLLFSRRSAMDIPCLLPKQQNRPGDEYCLCNLKNRKRWICRFFFCPIVLLRIGLIAELQLLSCTGFFLMLSSPVICRFCTPSFFKISSATLTSLALSV